MSEREEDILIESLNSADEETRRQAIELLGELRLKKAVPKIAELVNSENWRIRKSIVEAYKKIDDDSCLPLLQKLIKDSNVEVHSTAIDAMVYYGDRAIPYLLPLLKDDDEDARILSANVLGFMRSAKGVKSLIERLKVEDSMNVRYAIIEALGYIGNEEAIDYLLELLEKEDMYLKIVIIEALGKIGSLRACVVIMSLLEDELLRSVCIDALGNIGAEISINTIIEYFNSDDDTNVRVVIAIGKIYSKHINNQSYAVLIKEICKQFFKKKERYDKLLELLKNDNIELRNSVLLILSWIDELKLTKELMELLANEDYTEKIKDLFIRLGDRVLDDLYNEINKTDNYEIRKAIIQIIGLIGNSREIELLMKMLDNENERGYYDVIISSLGWLQAECSVEKLEKLLNEEDDNIRLASIGALSLIGSKAIVEFCAKNINSEDLKLKISCIKILGFIGDSNAIEILKYVSNFENAEVKLAYIQALNYLNKKEGIDLIVKFINEPDARIKEAVVETFERLNDKSVVPYLLKLLKDEDMWIKYFALRTLKKYADETIKDKIISLLDYPAGLIKIAVLDILAKINYKIEFSKILNLLDDEDIDVRIEIIKYCEKLNIIEFSNRINDLIKSEDWRIKNAVIEAIGTFGKNQPQYLELLFDIFANPDSDIIIKKQICRTMGKLRTLRTFEFLLETSKNEELYTECFDALLNFEEEYILKVLEKFWSLNEFLQLLVIHLIENSKTTIYDDKLIYLLNNTNSPTLKYEIIVCMGKLNRKKFINTLYPLAYPDKNIQKIAQEVLNILKK